MKTFPTQPAPTAVLIQDVQDASNRGWIDTVERDAVLSQLREGAIICPLWEDYGLRTDKITGRPVMITYWNRSYSTSP